MHWVGIWTLTSPSSTAQCEAVSSVKCPHLGPTQGWRSLASDFPVTSLITNRWRQVSTSTDTSTVTWLFCLIPVCYIQSLFQKKKKKLVEIELINLLCQFEEPCTVLAWTLPLEMFRYIAYPGTSHQLVSQMGHSYEMIMM